VNSNRDHEKSAQFLQEKRWFYSEIFFTNTTVYLRETKQKKFTNCHQIVTIKVKAVLTLAVPVMPS
jgi:hypothetical protein